MWEWFCPKDGGSVTSCWNKETAEETLWIHEHGSKTYSGDRVIHERKGCSEVHDPPFQVSSRRPSDVK